MSVRDRPGNARDDAVIAMLRDLAPALDGEPDPAFRAATRARLVAMAAVRSPEPEPVTGLKRALTGRVEDVVRSRWRSRLTAGLAGAALTVTAAASLVALSGNARPGDVLYGLKRGTEQTQLALAGDARGRTLLDFAGTRLSELRELVDQPNALPAGGGASGADPKLVISTLETMDDQTTEGTAWLTQHAVTTRSGTPLDDLTAWAATQTDGLASLAPELPSAAGSAVAHSLELLGRVSTRTQGLQTALTCSAGHAVGTPDGLGPVPVPCAPATDDPAQQSGTGDPATSATGRPGAPAVPTAPSGGTGGGAGTLPGGSPLPATTAVPPAPSLAYPGNPVPSLPLPSITVPTLTVPNIGLPGTTLSPGVCLPPVQIGSC